MVSIENLPLPEAAAKEIIVRVNTNRLNPFSYWYCLDKAGIDEKKRVYRSFKQISGFKESFESVDQAIQKANRSRVGRPAKNCLLNLFLMTDTEDVSGIIDGLEIDNGNRSINQSSIIDICTFATGWAGRFGISPRQASLLESEFNFRIILAGNQIVEALLSGVDPQKMKSLIDLSTKLHGPGTRQTTLEAYKIEMDVIIGTFNQSSAVDHSKFWSAGQIRSGEYEAKLKAIYPDYNTAKPGFLGYRPDLTITSYSPCSLAAGLSDHEDHINASIMREANVCEFTAFKSVTLQSIQGYVQKKFNNYIEVIQEQ